jgi:hypothetical protein
MNLNFIIKCSAALLMLIIIGSYLLIVRYEPVSKNILSERPQQLDILPIGEISQGFRVEQLVDRSSISDRYDTFEHESVCIELYLANWSDRRNSGQFAVDIILDKEVFTHIIDAAVVVNNANHKACFDNVSVDMLFDAHNIHLVLRGISSPPGAAVTAWTTTDLSSGQLIDMLDHLLLRSLVFNFSTRSFSESPYRHALMLIIFGMIAIGTMFMSFFSFKEKKLILPVEGVK